MKTTVPAFFLYIAMCFSAASGATTPASGLDFAERLLADGDGRAAALELRRLAADSDDAEERAALETFAASCYLASGDYDRLSKALERGSDDFAGNAAVPLFLRLKLAEKRRDWLSASLYAETMTTLAEEAGDSALAEYAARVRASDALLAHDTNEALAAAADDPASLRIVQDYAAGHDKSPRLGGILGIIPGLGYAYSGEWGNMVRSILLNGLFGYAMYECADHDEWGLFAMSTFFEMTWFSGSIYGGIDAAHRYNKQRLETAAAALRSDREPTVRRDASVPVLRLSLSF